MIRFKRFLETQEEEKDIQNTLNKIPDSHAELVRGFTWKFHSGNTLDGDDQHVGYMDDEQQEIAVAGPWNYGREFTILHEIAHKVWEKLPKQLHQQWVNVVNKIEKNDEALNQNPEELFCHFYAAYYSKNPPAKFYQKEPFQFIEGLPK